MKVTSLIFLAASATAAAASNEFKPKVKLINRRDAMPIPGVFMNAVQAVPALRKRDLGKPFELAEAPGKVQKRSLLETRQWGCETVGQINCSFEGCCNQGTVCGTYGGQTGCCPIGKTCTGVGSCKATETACGTGCCPSNASCTTNAGGSAACDYGLGSSSSMGTSRPTATSSRSLSSPTPTGSSSGGSCPNNYSPCPDSDSCCPAGVKCLPDKKCDATCSATDVRCGTGCCKDGFTCDTSTSICQEGGGSTNDTGDSDSGSTLLPKSTTTSGSGGGSKTDSPGGSTTLGGSTAQTGVAVGGSGGSGSSGIGTASGVGSSGPRLIFGMGVAGIVAVVGVALL